MNPLIKELISLSYDTIPHEREWDSTSQVFNKEKFALLIVKECIKVALQNDDIFTAQDMANHFGEVDYESRS